MLVDSVTNSCRIRSWQKFIWKVFISEIFAFTFKHASNIMIEAVYFPVQTTEKQSLPLRLLNMIYYKVFQISRRKSAVIGNIELFNQAPWEFSPQSDYFKLLLHIWGTKPINVWLFSTFILVAFIGFSACECWFCLSRWKLTCEENIMEQLSIVVIQS